MMIDETTKHLFDLTIDDFCLAVCFGMIGRGRSELNMEHIKERGPEFAHKYGVSVGDDFVWETVMPINV